MSKALALVTAFALATAACGTREFVIGGAVVGGTSGGMIGNQVSDGPGGTTLGAVTGVVLGAFIGFCIGLSKEEPVGGDDDD